MIFDLASYIYEQTEGEILVRMLQWAYEQERDLPDRTEAEEKTLEFVRTAMFQLERPERGER